MFWYKKFGSLEGASANPASVGGLYLIKPGVDFSAFATLLPKLINLREIEVGWQSWTELPEALAGLQKLRKFCVLNMPIQTFPAFLASCPRLTELVLRGTDITHIPPSVQEFKHLRRLDFSNHPSPEVPPQLGQLSELRELQLHDIGLTSLPDSIAGLRRLRRLIIVGNPIREVEVSRIRSWFRPGVVSAWSVEEQEAAQQ
ncbi:leucine-rich repeat domain-containing protein [Brevifollis gellanilyticus]|uniref:leucine-rich repeat domain-containing protein n=1 Tax=Brevifollis gellanilyticus TaxID=748831 RepID=UPI0011BEF1A7|nr:leucine-rich repeat domain-containing protein [Brevifollis gellanilyticus]